jgi:TolB-like protein/Tfp pilus assembly protein PilF
MAENTNPHPITIDLNQFKLHIELKNRIELTLHFNSPSRKFYLSVIAFVVNEMKRLGKITSIPLQGHHDLLALLNETVGESAGSSETETLLSRIYRKWQHALPNLEEAPLFAVLGRKKGYDEGTVKTYHFTETEKDIWANLFEYKGSHENVRLKFAIDKLGATLDDIVIIYEDFLNADAWEKFISGLKEKEAEPEKRVSEEPEVAGPPLEKRKTLLPSRYRWVALMAAIVVVLGTITLAIWKTYLRPDRGHVTSIEKMALSLPDKPSIAVFPFVNMSEDPKQEILCDGFAEEIINALTKLPQVFVIARNSSFSYKGKKVDIKQVGQELGVQYLVEGSVRREGNRIRITAQLIDSTTNRHLFSERYDRELKDIFAMQDDIAIKILTALRVALKDGEWARIQARGVSNVEAYFKLLKAREFHENANKESNDRARRLAEEALVLDPRSSEAYATIAYCFYWDHWFGTLESLEDSNIQGIAMAKKAIVLDDSPRAHATLGLLYLNKRDYDRAVEEAERAASMDPGFLPEYGATLWVGGLYPEAIAVFEKVLRRDPVKPRSTCLFGLATSYQAMGKYDEAVRVYKRLLQAQPDHWLGNIQLTATYSKMGRMEDARAQATEVLRLDPKFSVERFLKRSRAKDREAAKCTADALRKAGLK